ncbi:CaiB/BaiF CoA transferase family protein [Neobacillus thermocopriae]|uniref:CoA transferase n=1 Tax=Neobacillus thermocopriae TaxID=1215031 RepID=A0A6B3TQD0_9BACI|nr:CaiB/BaiF CoA-transferase family protein [Neobacillus thermocopriae]MED3624776.1 CaiB/BaiF CoA-transferase family protein [Neobacillus thermocopriae]MED3713074.1 CaiB/BaiF CoA-transferase family protein [Neobacillus thermocopriae]NEX78549.1 CoA transferase [Neobacillus thermocopriae]
MLKGIRVIDFTNYLPGPFATLRLAELGAEIIKIEPPGGDPARHTGITKNGNGIIFQANNRQKKSMTLNLKHNEEVEIALKLISSADVVIESFRPGVMEKLGLGYEDAKKVKPDIVYCSITGYGQEGQLSTLGNHDINYMALSGILSQFKDKTGRPVHPSITLADYLGGFAANERILAGLVSRSLTGNGSYHSISITDQLVSLLGNHVMVEKELNQARGIPILNGSIISYALYETSDGRYMSLGALEPKFWQNFCQAHGREDWITEHFSKTEDTNPVFQEVTALFKSKTFYEWIEFAQKVDCCLAPVLEIGELQDNPYFKEKQLIFKSPWGDYQVKMHSDLPQKTLTPPPKKDEHKEEILENILI